MLWRRDLRRTSLPWFTCLTVVSKICGAAVESEELFSTSVSYACPHSLPGISALRERQELALSAHALPGRRPRPASPEFDRESARSGHRGQEPWRLSSE